MDNGVNPATAAAASWAGSPAANTIRAGLNDIVAWSVDAPVWQREALRRLYVQQKLSASAARELYALCRQVQDLLEESEAGPEEII